MHQRIDWKDNVYLALPFIIMFVLYYSSSMTYQEQSLVSGLDVALRTEPFHNLLSSIEFTFGNSVVSIENLGYVSFVEFFIRKGAHFFSYFFLGLFWFLGLHKRVRDEWLVIILSILLSIGYASFDELRQSFNPGRTALMADVMLDTAGAAVGIGVAKILKRNRIIK